MIDHAWENIDAYIAGELTTAEREQFERHLAECESCKQAVADAQRLEQTMTRLFAEARPDATLDDRIIQRLHQEPTRSFRRPTLWRFVGAAAAVLVVGLIGAAVQAVSGDGDAALVKVAKEMRRDAGLKVGVDLLGGVQVHGLPREGYFGVVDLGSVFEEDNDKGNGGKDAGKYANALHGLITKESDIQYMSEKPMDDAVSGEGKAREAIDIENGSQKAPLAGRYTAGTLTPSEKNKDALRDALDLNKRKARFDPADSFYRGAPKQLAQERSYYTDQTAAVLDDVLKRLEADKGGGSQEGPDIKTKMSEGLEKKRVEEAAKLLKPTTEAPSYMPIPPPSFPSPAVNAPPALTLPTTTSSPRYFADGFVPKAPPGDDKAGEKKQKGETDDFSKDIKEKADGGKGDVKDGDAKSPVDEGKKPQPKADPKKPLLPEEPPSKKPPLPDEPPIETNRKIIRTGEMEFEIDSFDKTVENVTGLITKVKGGFVATINSDKLPNGKMKGAIVVRMPPQFLDRFVLDLRRELAKTGELKNQRIISLDVTKQYTDIESRLRAARTMEERLIQIIKVGKGEIKDLVAAERELGNWRTKIEEMEGEIRYYGNQVSLSTLTVQLYEKEILAPTAIVVSESVRMRLEVDDVAKAHKAAMDLVEKLDGRITRSELKQHMAGQLQSILCADIPPKNKDAFRDALKKLGIVSLHDENQSQHTEGGVGKSGALKPRQDDVHFDITMHNTANIAPSRSTDMKIATADVPAAYARLLDEIVKADGQVRDGKLNEQEKLNVHAVLDFNVPTAKKAQIDKVLAEIGPVLERINARAPINQISTERKFGYLVTLRDFASIPPSKAAGWAIAVNDVPTTFAKLVEAIKAAKGKADAKLNEKDKQDITAHFAFSVPAEEKANIDKLLAELGTMLSRNDVEAPANQLATDKKFGYVVDLRDFAAIPPSQSSGLTIAASNVPGNYAKLTEAIAKAKGQIRNAKLDEKDKLNVSARVEFTVPSAERPAIEKLLDEMGTMLSRINEQAPANLLSTDRKFGYAVDLRDFANIPARETFVVQAAVTDVPAAFREFQELIARAKGWSSVSKLVEDNKPKISAQLDFDVPTADKERIEALLKKSGVVLSRNSNQIGVSELATAKKVGYRVTLLSSTTLVREYVALKFDVADVDAKSADLKVIVLTAKGRVIDSGVEHYENGQAIAVLKLEVPAASQDEVIRQMKGTAKLVSQKLTRDSKIPESELTMTQLIVTLAGTKPIMPPDEGLGTSVHQSLYLSFRILTGIVMALIVGLSAIVPIGLLIWIGFKAYAILVGSSLQPVPSLAPASGSHLAAEEERPADGDAATKG